MEMSSAPAQDKPVAPASCLGRKGPQGSRPLGSRGRRLAWPRREGCILGVPSRSPRGPPPPEGTNHSL